MSDLNNLSQQWLEAKTLERDAMERRLAIELEMAKCLKLQDSDEGTVSHAAGPYKIKAACRINRKIDPEQFLLLANDAKIDVTEFTKWKCELVMSAWKKQTPFVQQALSKAITAAPGKPTFTIEITE